LPFTKSAAPETEIATVERRKASIPIARDVRRKAEDKDAPSALHPLTRGKRTNALARCGDFQGRRSIV
jgi:hypothetical protein